MRAHGSDPVINALFTAVLWCLSATARKLPAGSVLPITCLDDHIKTLRAARASHRAAGKMSSAFVVSFLCVWSEMGSHLTYKWGQFSNQNQQKGVSLTQYMEKGLKKY